MKNIQNSLILQIQYSYKYPLSWSFGAWVDLKNKYRRTVLGLGWNFLALAVTMLIMTIVWSKIFEMEMNKLFPYIFNGFAIFFFITNSLNTSCYSLAQVRKDIYVNIPIPVLSIILRDVFQQILTYFHYVIFIFVMYIYLNDFNYVNILLYLIGIIIVFFQTVLLSLLITFAATRFRDVAALTTSLLSASTILTPIIWNKQMLGQYINYAYINPFTFMVEIVRDPILGLTPALSVYVYNILFLIVLFLASFVLVKFKGSRLIFWI